MILALFSLLYYDTVDRKIYDEVNNTWPHISPTDLGVKMGKIPGVIKGRFYVSASLSDSWETFTPPHARVTLGRFLHQLVVAFFSPTSIESIIYGKVLH